MNREKAKELLPIIDAYANGADIQYSVESEGVWRDDPDFSPFDKDIQNLIYRIKPEPRIWWIYDGNDEPEVTADIGDVADGYRHKWIKVREVLSDVDKTLDEVRK